MTMFRSYSVTYPNPKPKGWPQSHFIIMLLYFPFTAPLWCTTRDSLNIKFQKDSYKSIHFPHAEARSQTADSIYKGFSTLSWDVSTEIKFLQEYNKNKITSIEVTFPYEGRGGINSAQRQLSIFMFLHKNSLYVGGVGETRGKGEEIHVEMRNLNILLNEKD